MVVGLSGETNWVCCNKSDFKKFTATIKSGKVNSFECSHCMIFTKHFSFYERRTPGENATASLISINEKEHQFH